MAYVADQFVLDALFTKMETVHAPYYFLLTKDDPELGGGMIMNGPGPLGDLHLTALFHRCAMTHDEGVAYWRECQGDNEGYIVLYPDGEHLHTYHYPPNFL